MEARSGNELDRLPVMAQNSSTPLTPGRMDVSFLSLRIPNCFLNHFLDRGPGERGGVICPAAVATPVFVSSVGLKSVCPLGGHVMTNGEGKPVSFEAIFVSVVRKKPVDVNR